MKKKRSAALALLFIFAFMGCKNKQSDSSTPPAIIPSYEADVKINFNEVEITCHIIQQNFEETQIEIYTPEEIKGFIISKTHDGCNLKFKDMDYKMDLSKYPNASFAQIMTKAYSALVNSDGLKVIKKDKYWIYEGSIDSGGFIITQSDETGFTKKIEVPKVGMSAEFSNIKSIAPKQ